MTGASLLPITTSTGRHIVHDVNQAERNVIKFFRDCELLHKHTWLRLWKAHASLRPESDELPSNVAQELEAFRDRVILRIPLNGLLVLPHAILLFFESQLPQMFPNLAGFSKLSKVAIFGIVFSCLALVGCSCMSMILSKVQDDSRKRCERKSIERIKLYLTAPGPTPLQLMTSLTLPERLFIENAMNGTDEDTVPERLSKYLTFYGIEEKPGDWLRSVVETGGAAEECARLLVSDREDGYAAVLEAFAGIRRQNWKQLHSIWSLALPLSISFVFIQIFGMIIMTKAWIVSALVFLPVAFFAWILLPLIVTRG